MSEAVLNKLLEYIDARIAEKSQAALESSDGGLIESMRTSAVEKELRELAAKDLI